MSFIREIPEVTVQKCKEFAEKSLNSSSRHYARRGQLDTDKIKKDISSGKLAEFGAFVFLYKNGVKDVTLPDIEIYGKERKTFESDMKSSNRNFHVKSCQANGGFPPSWVFQYGRGQSRHFDPLIESESESDIVIFSQVKGSKVEIKGFLSAKKIRELNLYKDPKLDRLKGQKLCVYWDDIKDLGNDVIWDLNSLI